MMNRIEQWLTGEKSKRQMMTLNMNVDLTDKQSINQTIDALIAIRDKHDSYRAAWEEFDISLQVDDKRFKLTPDNAPDVFRVIHYLLIQPIDSIFNIRRAHKQCYTSALIVTIAKDIYNRQKEEFEAIYKEYEL